MVREEDEELVDQLIEEAETTSLPTLAPEVEKLNMTHQDGQTLSRPPLALY